MFDLLFDPTYVRQVLRSAGAAVVGSIPGGTTGQRRLVWSKVVMGPGPWQFYGKNRIFARKDSNRRSR